MIDMPNLGLAQIFFFKSVNILRQNILCKKIRFGDYHETVYPLNRPTLLLVKNHNGLSESAQFVWAFSLCLSESLH